MKMVDGGNQVVGEDNTTQIISKNAIRYRGYYYDEETKLYYLQSRYYNPDVGRFLNADGMLNGNGDILGYNMFAYCGNNPVNYSDPSGCGKFWEWIKKNFGFESTASYTEKTKGYGWGNKFLLQYEPGEITKITTTETSDASVVCFVNADNSETISLGSRSDFISASVNLGFSGWGASTSINSDVFSGEFELTTSPVFTTVTVVKYAKFSDNYMEGTYESFQINNMTLGAIAIVSVYCPQVFGAFVSAYATAVGSGAVPLPT